MEMDSYIETHCSKNSIGLDYKGNKEFNEFIQPVEGNDTSLPSHRLLSSMESRRWITSKSGGRCNNWLWLRHIPP
jgi:hypothetical protein